MTSQERALEKERADEDHMDAIADRVWAEFAEHPTYLEWLKDQK